MDAVNAVIQNLQEMRSSAAFDGLFRECEELIEKYHVKKIKIASRLRRPPAKLDNNPSTAAKESCEIHFQRIYFIVIDILLSEMKDHFDQPGKFHVLSA